MTDGYASSMKVFSCSLPGCDGSKAEVVQSMDDLWGPLTALSVAGNGFVYFAHGGTTIRKMPDDGANTNASSVATLVYTGSVASNFTRFEGKLYWADASLVLWSLDLADDSVSAAGFTFHTTAEVP